MGTVGVDIEDENADGEVRTEPSLDAPAGSASIELEGVSLLAKARLSWIEVSAELLEVRQGDGETLMDKLRTFADELNGYASELRGGASSDPSAVALALRFHDLRNVIIQICQTFELAALRGSPVEVERVRKLIQMGAALFEADFDRDFFKFQIELQHLGLILGVDIQTNCPPVPEEFIHRYPALQTTALYCIFSNILLNAKRHGGATEWDVSFEPMSTDRLKIFFSDNGRGFKGVDPFVFREDQREGAHGLAMSGARDALRAVGGDLYPLDTSVEGGAVWVMELPFKLADAARAKA